MSDLRTEFRLNDMPFTCEMPIAKRLEFSFTTETLQGVFTAVERRMSAVITAPSGTGKTVLLRALCDKLPEARYDLRYLKVADITKRDMCREICSAIGIETVGSYPKLLRRLQERFASTLGTDGLRPVLILDEAHVMRPDVLAMLRLVTNFEMDSKLVVSIVLAGQNPLSGMLRRNELSDIARRISFYGKLRLLTREELLRYVKHRMAIVGSVKEVFAPDAMDAIYEFARGNLRATDYLALASLEVAVEHGKTVVESAHVAEAAKRVSP